ncbi:QacE family quaternary ammonium compound efflux SMR transporter [Burkholderia sp. Bp9031]|uniref:DMT family transporter n=1 Tax=Burkholderia sp. Bp9031 TaxID=2184566 RepID=UPI0007166934|nr:MULTISPECIES: multidrug efflux SMR transporter [Burkholderia]RQZ12453.1 QacE family quaternary ammonium compound efflux SMR transporter [Burkholderia sp. Bp9031]
MAWFFVILAGVFEILFATSLKYSAGFTRLWPTVGTALSLLFSMILLSASVRSLPIGSAYAVWTGIGAAGTAVFGIYLFGDSASPARLFFLGCIVVGVIGLKIAQ